MLPEKVNILLFLAENFIISFKFSMINVLLVAMSMLTKDDIPVYHNMD